MTDVEKDTPAQRFGLQRGDILSEGEWRPVSTARAMWNASSEIHVWRRWSSIAVATFFSHGSAGEPGKEQVDWAIHGHYRRRENLKEGL